LANFNSFSYSKDGFSVKELFTLPMVEKMTIGEVKSLIFQKFKENNLIKVDDIEPLNLRFRSLSKENFPEKIFMDHEFVNVFSKDNFDLPIIGVSKLPNGMVEEKLSPEFVVVFLRQFLPSKYELGDLFEVCLFLEEGLKDLREKITEITGCKNVSIAEGDRWDRIKLSSVTRMKWFKPNNTDGELLYSISNLNIRDGDVVLFMDDNEPIKELSEEEKRKIRIKENKHITYTKERTLHIEQKKKIDVDV